MDDRTTSIKARLPHRHLTAGGSTDAALHLAPTGREHGITASAARTIFKKTRDVAGLKPRGRDVAKDILENDSMLFLVHALLGFDADVGTSNVKLTDAVLAERKTKWMPGATNHTSGVLGKYAQQFGPAVDGVVTHPGGAHEKQCYADI